jgi:hypothetical protein
VFTVRVANFTSRPSHPSGWSAPTAVVMTLSLLFGVGAKADDPHLGSSNMKSHACPATALMGMAMADVQELSRPFLPI